jgi:hypothetical protein
VIFRTHFGGGGVKFVTHINESRMRRNRDEEYAAAIVVASVREEPRSWGGSVYGHQVHYRDRETAFRELCRRYFDNNTEFDDRIFRRR